MVQFEGMKRFVKLNLPPCTYSQCAVTRVRMRATHRCGGSLDAALEALVEHVRLAQAASQVSCWC